YYFDTYFSLPNLTTFTFHFSTFPLFHFSTFPLSTFPLMSDDPLHLKAAPIGIAVARRHIFLCAEQTKPKCCDMERGVTAWEFLKRRLKELGLSEQGGI